MKGDSINDTDRNQWIDNDEGLYDWFRRSRQSKSAFIKANRAEIDTVIRNVRDGVKPQHYLTYHHGPGCPCSHCRTRMA